METLDLGGQAFDSDCVGSWRVVVAAKAEGSRVSILLWVHCLDWEEDHAMSSTGTTLSMMFIALADPEDLSCCLQAVLDDYLELASQPKDFILHVDACSCWFAYWGVGSSCRSRCYLFEMSYESYRDLETLLMDLSTGSFCLESSVLFASACLYSLGLCDMGLCHLAPTLLGFTLVL